MSNSQSATIYEDLSWGSMLFPHVERAVPYRAPVHRISADTSIFRFQASEQQVENFALLRDDWDGYGALPISMEARRNALAFLGAGHGSMPAPEISPNSNGTISFVWEGQLGTVHLEIGSTRFSLYMKPIAGSTTYAEGETLRLGSEVAEAVSSFLQRSQGRASSWTGLSTRGAFEALAPA